VHGCAHCVANLNILATPGHATKTQLTIRLRSRCQRSSAWSYLPPLLSSSLRTRSTTGNGNAARATCSRDCWNAIAVAMPTTARGVRALRPTRIRPIHTTAALGWTRLDSVARASVGTSRFGWTASMPLSGPTFAPCSKTRKNCNRNLNVACLRTTRPTLTWTSCRNRSPQCNGASAA
jgi:hypothetical protein